MLRSRLFIGKGLRWRGLFGAPPRRIQAFGVGAAKSGTHSIAGLFAQNYRSRHEPEHSPMIKLILAGATGVAHRETQARFFASRDRRLLLEMDSSQLHGSFIDVLPGLFPKAKFILTIRVCYAYLHSVINHQLARGGGSETWTKMSEARFGGYTHSVHEQPLIARGLFPLDGYLSYWSRHNQAVLRAVPADRLLVVRTHEIGQSLSRISEFLEIPVDSLDATQAHAYPAVKHYGVIEELDSRYLEDRVHVHCHSLMQRFFPGRIDQARSA